MKWISLRKYLELTSHARLVDRKEAHWQKTGYSRVDATTGCIKDALTTTKAGAVHAVRNHHCYAWMRRGERNLTTPRNR